MVFFSLLTIAIYSKKEKKKRLSILGKKHVNSHLPALWFSALPILSDVYPTATPFAIGLIILLITFYTMSGINTYITRAVMRMWDSLSAATNSSPIRVIVTNIDRAINGFFPPISIQAGCKYWNVVWDFKNLSLYLYSEWVLLVWADPPFSRYFLEGRENFPYGMDTTREYCVILGFSTYGPYNCI